MHVRNMHTQIGGLDSDQHLVQPKDPVRLVSLQALSKLEWGCHTSRLSRSIEMLSPLCYVLKQALNKAMKATTFQSVKYELHIYANACIVCIRTFVVLYEVTFLTLAILAAIFDPFNACTINLWEQSVKKSMQILLGKTLYFAHGNGCTSCASIW